MWIRAPAQICRTFSYDTADRPHLYVRSEEQVEAEDRRARARASGSNTTPLLHVEERRGAVKRLSSPERFEIKQLIASGAVKASDVSCHQLSLTSSIPTLMKITTLVW